MSADRSDPTPTCPTRPCRADDDLITVAELADYFRTSRGAIYVALHRRSLGVPAIRLGSRVRFKWRDVQAALHAS